MKQIISLLFLSTFLLCIVQCRNLSFENRENIDLRKAFKYFVESSCSIDSSELDLNKKQPLEIVFYKKNKKDYVRIVETVGISFRRIKGYCEYEDYMIAYYGINDSLAKKYLDLIEEDIAILRNDYCNLDDGWIVDIPSFKIKDYRIKNDTIFERFKPTKFQLDEYRNLLIEAGVLLNPPPPPY